MSVIVLGFPESGESAKRLADCLSLPCGEISVRSFPDHESLVRIPSCAATVILLRSLNDPNDKLIELILAASAARDSGARRVILVAPYLAYMRQDMAFHPGEAVSQRVIGKLIAEYFDALITVDPHLHRITTLGEAVPGIQAIALSAAPSLARMIDTSENPVIVGPDGESRQWIESIARPLGLDMLLGHKERHGDRDVTLSIEGIDLVRDRPAILVDDIISSGQTLVAAGAKLLEAGARHIQALATHCLASPVDLARIGEGRITTIITTDSVAGTSARVELAPLLAEALEKNLLLQS